MFHCFSSILQRWQELDQLKREMETFESTALKRKMETEHVQLLNATAQDPDWYTKVHPQRKNDEHMAGA